jgi:type I restriction enzyme R subunit
MSLTLNYQHYRNTKLAVVEAKAWAMALTEGVGQAKSYAAKLSIRHTYATNGQGIYGIDMHTGAEGEVALYPTPDELWEMTFGETEEQAAAWRKRFTASSCYWTASISAKRRLCFVPISHTRFWCAI